MRDLLANEALGLLNLMRWFYGTKSRGDSWIELLTRKHRAHPNRGQHVAITLRDQRADIVPTKTDLVEGVAVGSWEAEHIMDLMWNVWEIMEDVVPGDAGLVPLWNEAVRQAKRLNGV